MIRTVLSGVVFSIAVFVSGSTRECLAQGAPDAQESKQPTENPPRVREEITVTAARTAESLSEAPASVSVIDSATIAAAPSQDIGDLLRIAPGVNVTQLSARDTNVTTRAATGAGAKSQLVLVDGREINAPFFGNVMWDMIPAGTGDIDRIEVVNSPASAVWGAGAMSGVIQVLTKSPRDAVGTSLTINAGTFAGIDGNNGGSLANVELLHAAAVSDRTSYRLSIGAGIHDAFPRPTGTLPNPSMTAYPNLAATDARQVRMDGRLDFAAGSQRLFVLRAGYAAPQGMLITRGGPFRLEPGNRLTYVQGDMVEAAWSARAYVNVLNGRASSLFSRGAGGSPTVSNFDTTTSVLEAMHEPMPLPIGHLSFGASVRHDSFDLSIAPRGDKRDQFGGYLEDRIDFGRGIRAVAGIRADHFSVINGAVFSPRAAVLWSSHDQTVRAAYNRAYRAPALLENYADFTNLTVLDLALFSPQLQGRTFDLVTRFTGSDTLREETLRSYEIGYAGAFRRTRITATYYQIQTSDVIVLRQVASFSSTNVPPGWPLPPQILDALVQAGRGLPAEFGYRNSGSVTNRGLELGVNASSRFASVFANYTWQRTPETSRGLSLADVNEPPQHSVNAGFTVNRGPAIASATVEHSSSAVWNDVLDPRFHGPTEAYTTLNAMFGWRFRNVTPILRVLNLTNERVQQHVFGDIITRQIIAELRWQM